MANILFIAYDYPPILSPESIQVQRRALTLANNGHQIYILSIHNNPSFEFIDKTLVQKHQNIKLIQTNKPLMEKLYNVFCKYLDITDRKYWWKWIALKKAHTLIKQYNIDILYSHSTPLVDHLVGLNLKKYYPKLKWIAHFSDPWTLNPYKQYKFKFQYRLNKKLEEKVLQSCNVITMTSEKTKQLFHKNFKNISNKIYVLPHTFDKSRYNKSQIIKDKKIIVHTGNIYGLRTIKYLLESLTKIELNNYEFHFYGKIKQEELELIKIYNLKDKVKVFTQIPYLESLKIISNADYLMVIDAPLENSPFFPSKLADYIGAKKPIIALTPKTSATYDILKFINNNIFVANSNSIDEINKLLLNLNNISNEYTNIDYYSMDNYDLLKGVFEK